MVGTLLRRRFVVGKGYSKLFTCPYNPLPVLTGLWDGPTVLELAPTIPTEVPCVSSLSGDFLTLSTRFDLLFLEGSLGFETVQHLPLSEILKSFDQ